MMMMMMMIMMMIMIMVMIICKSNYTFIVRHVAQMQIDRNVFDIAIFLRVLSYIFITKSDSSVVFT